MIRLDLSTTRAAGLEVLLGGAEMPNRKSIPDEAGLAMMTIALPDTPPATHWLVRVPLLGCTSSSLQPALPESFTFDTPLDQGIVGPVFAGRRAGDDAALVAKVALYEAERRVLLHEAAIYRQLQRVQGRVVPRVFGLFVERCRRFSVLVLAHRGTGVGCVAELSRAQRASLYDDLETVHWLGVVHGDLRAENIVVADDGAPTLIDFSHARMHRCRGPSGCAELHEGRSFLML